MKAIRVLHYINELDESFGGPSRSVPLLVASLSRLGVENRILAVESIQSRNNEIIESQGLHVVSFSVTGSRSMCFSKDLLFSVNDVFATWRPDIVHFHTIWPLSVSIVLRASRLHRCSIVVSPRSSLFRESLKKSRLKKLLARRAYVNRLLDQPTLLHATDPLEVQELIAFGIQEERIVTIPNGLEPPLMARAFGTDRIALARRIPIEISSTDRIALFLARIHPRKNTLQLVHAAREIMGRHPEWKLVVAGPCEDDAYLRSCKVAAGPLLDSGRIVFPGMLRGEAKHAILAAADLFLLPTKFENFGLSIGEALAMGLPVITTTTTPWHQIADAGAGWIIPPEDHSSLVAAWSAAASCDDATLRAMGARAIPLTQAFTWERVAKAFIDIYQPLKSVPEQYW